MSKFKWLALGLALLPLAAGAETYKCRAPNGKISYSGQMSMERGVKCEPMFVRKPPTQVVEPTAEMQMPGNVMPQDPANMPADAARSAAPPTPAAKTPADLELDAKRKQMEEEEARKKADKEAQDKIAQQKIKEENCAAAQANLRTFQSGGRISRVDEKGEKVFLDDNEIKQRAEEAQQEVSRWCS